MLTGELFTPLTPDELARLTPEQLSTYRAALEAACRSSNAYQTDFAGWCTDNRVFLWSKQIEIARSVVENRRTVVVATHGVGKSFTAAQLVVWWIDQHPIGEAVAVTTAPTGRQVKAILWQEINKAARRSGAPGRVDTVQWKIGDHLAAFGQKPAEHDSAAFQGIHGRYLLVVIDECAGVPKSIWQDAVKLVTNENGRILAIGNADYENSNFHEATRSPLWQTMRIAFADSPAATGEPVPERVAEMLVSQLWVDELIAEHGAESAAVQRMVEGKFVTDRADGVIWGSKISASADLVAAHGDRVAGVDVAAGGTDNTVVWVVDGNEAIAELVFSERDSRAQASKIADFVSGHDCERVYVDSIGVGYAMVGLIEERVDVAVVPVNVAQASTEPKRFWKLRDELWWRMREQIHGGVFRFADDVGVLADTELMQHLTEPRYTTDTGGRIRVESKKDMKARGIGSPDRADALILAACGQWAGGLSAPMSWA